MAPRGCSHPRQCCEEAGPDLALFLLSQRAKCCPRWHCPIALPWHGNQGWDSPAALDGCWVPNRGLAGGLGASLVGRWPRGRGDGPKWPIAGPRRMMVPAWRYPRSLSGTALLSREAPRLWVQPLLLTPAQRRVLQGCGWQLLLPAPAWQSASVFLLRDSEAFTSRGAEIKPESSSNGNQELPPGLWETGRVGAALFFALHSPPQTLPMEPHAPRPSPRQSAIPFASRGAELRSRDFTKASQQFCCRAQES